jgi:ribonuclease PH
MTGGGRYVELQATGEKTAFDDSQLAALIGLGTQGVRELIDIQKSVLKAS